MGKIPIILLIVIILVLASIVIAPQYLTNSKSDTIVAVANVDKTLARFGETYFFDANASEGKISNYIWNFGDGNISIEMNPSYIYEYAGIYNVTLTVIGEDGQEDNVTLIIGNQYEDYSATLDTGRYRETSRSGMSGYGVHGVLGPNMGNPTLTIQGPVTRAVGNFILEVRVYFERYGSAVYEESISAMGEDIQVDVTLEPEDFPDQAQYQFSEISLIFWVDFGRYGSIDLMITVEYPYALSIIDANEGIA